MTAEYSCGSHFVVNECTEDTRPNDGGQGPNICVLGILHTLYEVPVVLLVQCTQYALIVLVLCKDICRQRCRCAAIDKILELKT